MESFSPIDLTLPEPAIIEIAGNVIGKNSSWFWWVLLFLFIGIIIFLLVEANKKKSNPDHYKATTKFV